MASRKNSIAITVTQKIDVELPRCGKVNVFIRGVRSANEVAVLTVHDIGCNHTEWEDFITNPVVQHLTNRIVWILVDIPGQGDNDLDLPDSYEFPSMQEIAEDLKHVLEKLNLKHVVVLGEGAGANIAARFAIENEDKVHGAVLIHCIGSCAKFSESMKEKFIGFKLKNEGMNQSAENFLVLHRYGNFKEAKSEQEVVQIVDNFRQSLRKSINPKNLYKFINSYMQRNTIVDKIHQLRTPVLFMTGVNASHIHSVRGLHEALIKSLKDEPSRLSKVELVQIDDCANCLTEKPESVAESLQYFLQGLGLVVSVMNRRQSDAMQFRRSRTTSMEEQDKPKGAEQYLYNPKRKYSVGFGSAQEGISTCDE